jgi:hypothetical protein
MLLVLASLYDHAAQALVERWRERGARLFNCRDLSNAGWRLDREDARETHVSVGARVSPRRRFALCSTSPDKRAAIIRPEWNPPLIYSRS